jgi:hypothetical protein
MGIVWDTDENIDGEIVTNDAIDDATAWAARSALMAKVFETQERCRRLLGKL